MYSATPNPNSNALLAPLTDDEELALSEAMEGFDNLEELLDHVLDLGDKEWHASRRPARRPPPQVGN